MLRNCDLILDVMNNTTVNVAASPTRMAAALGFDAKSKTTNLPNNQPQFSPTRSNLAIAAALPQILNNGRQDLSSPTAGNNLNVNLNPESADVVKLQQQLQDIKDQVGFAMWFSIDFAVKFFLLKISSK